MSDHMNAESLILSQELQAKQVDVAPRGVPTGYKRTEVGVIPEEWHVATIAELIEEQSILGHLDGNHGELYPRSHEFKPYGVPYIGANDFDEGAVSFKECKFLSGERAARFRKGVARDGDVLFAHNATVGPVALLRTSAPFVILSTTATYFRCNTNRLNNAFLKGALQSEQFVKQYRAVMAQSTRFQVPITAQRKLSLVIPPLPEQRAIAEALGDVDALLGALDAAIAKQRDLKQAAMQQLLTGQTRLPGFQGDWDIRTVGALEKMRLVKLSRGQVISKKHIDNTPGECPIYSSSIHNDGLFGCYGYFMFDEELITWSVDGGGNFFHRRKHKFSVTNVCGFMRVETTRINYKFFAAELQLLHSRKSFDYQIKAHPSVIRKEYEVQIPPLPEQIAISTVLTDLDNDLTALESRRAKTAALKQVMMQELLTGRIRLLGTPSPSSADATSRAELGLGAPKVRPV